VACCCQGYRVIYREAHMLLEEIAEAALDGKRKEHKEPLTTVPLLIIDDLGMRNSLQALSTLSKEAPFINFWNLAYRHLYESFRVGVGANMKRQFFSR
jgi:IstB-like ATP binding protein